MVKLLLNEGADPNMADKVGRTALHVAIINASDEAIEILLDRGADPNNVDKWGRTAMTYALERYDQGRESYIVTKDKIKLLIDAGVRQNEEDRRIMAKIPTARLMWSSCS